MPAAPEPAPRRRLRLVLAGEWLAGIHEAAWSRGLTELGHEVIPFSWHERFARTGRFAEDLLLRAQNRFLEGPALRALNADLLALCARERPDAVLLYRPTHILPETVRALNGAKGGPAVVSYNNDDPFSPRARAGLWRHYLGALPFVDAHLVYRQKNVDELRARGLSNVQLVRSAYRPWHDRPVAPTPAQRETLGADVLFAGHYEPDGRMPFLAALDAAGIDLRLFGPEWHRAPREAWLSKRLPVRSLKADEYVAAIASAKIALCFLSGLNHDTYTRRCFEVPAIGTLLLCQRSADMEALLRPGVEADYFSTPAELLKKVRHYLADDGAREAVARQGQARVREAGHDVVSRMREVERIVFDVLARA